MAMAMGWAPVNWMWRGLSELGLGLGFGLGLGLGLELGLGLIPLCE